MNLHSLLVFASSSAGVLLAGGTAFAITLPDSGSCSDSQGDCLRITNSATAGGNAIKGVGSSGAVGLVGTSNSNVGIYGFSTNNAGVQGSSTNASGVYGASTNANGVVAQNNDTTKAAAAMSALAGSSNGLAYYGTGGILLSGSYAEKAGSTAWTNPSDSRIKRDVSTLRLGLDQLRQVRPVTFKYNGLGGTTDDGHEYVGVIAQELEKIFPSMVTTKKAKLHPTDAADTDIKVVDAGPLTYVLINSVKEQQAIIERQERRIAALEGSRRVSASMIGTNGVEYGLALGLLPFGFVALRRRKAAKAA